MKTKILTNLHQKVYRYIFWVGYFAVLATTFIPYAGEFNKIKIGTEAFHIRLDHLLHLLVYFLISMFYLFGMRKGLELFKGKSLLKFVLLILFLAILTEVIQLWIPERSFNVFDIISNVTGLAIGLGVIEMVQRYNAITA
jgi:VanZ family protein